MIAAVRAGDAGGPPAEVAGARWFRAAPSSSAAARAYLAAVAARKDPRPADPSAHDLLARAGRILHGGFASLGSVAAVKEADAGCWRAVLTASDQDVAAFASKCPRPAMAALLRGAPMATYTAGRRVFESHEAAGIVRAAREAATLLEANREDEHAQRKLRWLWFVAGDYGKARATLKAPAAATTENVKAPGTVDDEEALRVLLAAPPLADVRLRRSEYRRFNGGAWTANAGDDEDDDNGGGGDLDDAARARKARNERERDAIWHVGCLAAARGGKPQATLTACGQAWRRGRRTAATAVALGKALFENLEEARKQGLEAKTFLEQANAALGGRLPGHLLALESAWLVSHGRLREATAAAEQAWAAGAGQFGEGLAEAALGTAPFNPILARYRAAVPGTRTHKALGISVAAFSAGEPDVAAGYLSQARTFFQKDVDSEQEQVLALLEEMLALIEADFRDRALDGQGTARLVSRLFDDTRKDPFSDIAKDYPHSALAGVLLIEEAAGSAKPESEVARAKALAARFPRNAMVANDVALLFRKAGLVKEAAATWNAARRLRPDSPFLRNEIVVGKRTTPPVLASPEAHAQALAAPIEIPADAAALRAVVSEELGLRAIIPAAFRPGVAASGESFSKDGANFVLMRIPRMTFCEGLSCLDQLVPGLEQNGLKQRWRRIFTTPVGPGAEAFLESELGVLIVAAIPGGGHVYLMMMGGPPERVAAQIPALRMAYLTFRPDDLVLTASLAGKLRATWLDARKILRARALLARPPTGGGCPLAPLLDARDVDVGDRRQLLLDAFVATPWVATRRGLLKCEQTDASGSPALTLAALWDDDQSIRRIGAARAAAHPAEVLAEAKSLMRGDLPIEPPAGSTGAVRDHRWVALLVALPPKERAELARALLRQDPPHLRAVGLLAPRLGDVAIGPEHLRIVSDGRASEARIGAQSLPDTLTRSMREAIWARLDRAKRPLAQAEADALFELARHLTKHPDRGDRARLERLARLVSAGPRGDRARAEALLNVRPEPAAPPVGPLLLAPDRSLAEMLPGNRWTFVRIPRPSQLLSRLSHLGHRLKAPTDAHQRLVQAPISGIVSQIDRIVADAGALDLDRPIECAAQDGNVERLLCAASTRADLPDDLETTLRALGLLEDVAGGALAIPLALPALPFLLHQGLYARSEATRDGQESALLRERAERIVTAAEAPGATVTWNTHLNFGPDGAGMITDRIVLRRKDRLFFSNSAEMARRLLLQGAVVSPPASPPIAPQAAALGADPEFRQSAARLVADADMTAIAMPAKGEDAFKHPIALELAVNAHGVATRLRLPVKQRSPDQRLGVLWRLLPKEPTLVFGAADISPVTTATRPSPDGMPLLLSKVDGVGVAPPTWLAQATSAVLFGWYPREGGQLWEDWLAALGWDDKVAAAWRQHGMPAPSASGAPAIKDGYRFKLVGRVLVVSNADVLVKEASHRGETEAVPAREEPVKGTFDGGHVASALEDRAARAPTPQTSIALRTFAALSAIVKTATLGSVVSHDGSEVVIESLVSPSVDGGTGVALVEEWQRETRFRNSLRLPKSLGASDADRPIHFLLEIEQNQQMRRAFPVTARQKLAQISPGRWRLDVSPGPALADPVPAVALSAADRQRYTDAAGTAPRIQSAANEIVADKTPPKQAVQLILAWMKRNMAYEVTPRELRDEAILERRRGDCSEYSKLTVALLRAKGIPARMRSGFLADAGELVAHAWVEFFDGAAWREIDPTQGSSSVDARHLEASLVEVMSLLSLTQIKVAGVE